MKTQILAALSAFFLSGCVVVPVAPPVEILLQARPPVTILVSIDGFHPDYLGRGVTPVLSRLAAEGVSASMRPSFPSKTFPNHWTLVTGLRPDRNGIVANTMEDPRRPGETFTMASDDPFWWNEAEPIWVSAEKAGVRTATMFWPGANVALGGSRAKDWPNPVTGGVRPADWQHFNQQLPNNQRVDTVIDWLRRPTATRPTFLTVYFDTVDTAGHQFGPASDETTKAVAEIDTIVGRLVTELDKLGQPANIVIVADHGMAATSPDRIVALDNLVPKEDYRVVDSGAFASVVPAPGKERSVATALTRTWPNMKCWAKANIPARFHYGKNPRVAPILCLADVGWLVQRTPIQKPVVLGNHGYDADAPEMRALFIATGPAFRPGVRLPDFDNVSVAPLLRGLIGLPPATGLDGDDTPFRTALKDPR
ncbi:MAG TPA: ectonucleotide pyrophosphatase/phosphodiesterase [Sphingomicrobium sp.]